MGVWIETLSKRGRVKIAVVTPHVGVWIETNVRIKIICSETSLPTWECGLKHEMKWGEMKLHVTPHVGVWIETSGSVIRTQTNPVTPHVGVWIETFPLPRG